MHRSLNLVFLLEVCKRQYTVFIFFQNDRRARKSYTELSSTMEIEDATAARCNPAVTDPLIC